MGEGQKGCKEIGNDSSHPGITLLEYTVSREQNQVGTSGHRGVNRQGIQRRPNVAYRTCIRQSEKRHLRNEDHSARKSILGSDKNTAAIGRKSDAISAI
jgi:hypothetical protein